MAPQSEPAGADSVQRAFESVLRERLLRNERACGAVIAVIGAGTGFAVVIGRLSGALPRNIARLEALRQEGKTTLQLGIGIYSGDAVVGARWGPGTGGNAR